MIDPQRSTQLANIQAATGMTVAEFTEDVRRTGLEKHSRIVSYLKTEHGLTHGNANLIAHMVREQLAGGPAAAEGLLEAQYAGSKAHLRPILEALKAMAETQGGDVERVIQKTAVSFRRRKQFALVQAASSRRVQLGLNLPTTPDDERAREVDGMCTHRVDLTEPTEVDADVAAWIGAAYEAAG
jgi:hypothetical protein